MTSTARVVALSIAGSDSGGGAGIQADLKTFHAFGAFGTTAVTAITVQNTLGVQAVHAIPTDIVRQQIHAVADDLHPAAVKTGMLASAELIHAIADEIESLELSNYVLDPVMVASSGDRLLDTGAEASIGTRLLPLATLATPNLDEAIILSGMAVTSASDMRAAGEKLMAMGARAVLMKGGHLPGTELIDLLFDGDDWTEWRRPKLNTRNTHGTGCTLSAAIAAGLAHGRPLVDAVDDALGYVQRAIETAPGLGGGHGPLNHFAAARITPPTAD